MWRPLDDGILFMCQPHVKKSCLRAGPHTSCGVLSGLDRFCCLHSGSSRLHASQECRTVSEFCLRKASTYLNVVMKYPEIWRICLFGANAIFGVGMSVHFSLELPFEVQLHSQVLHLPRPVKYGVSELFRGDFAKRCPLPVCLFFI